MKSLAWAMVLGLITCGLAGCDGQAGRSPERGSLGAPASEPVTQAPEDATVGDDGSPARPSELHRSPALSEAPDRVMPAHRQRSAASRSDRLARVEVQLPQRPDRAVPPAAEPFVAAELRTPTRLARGADGTLCVSDAELGTVFIFDASGERIGELDGIERPLGMAIADDGAIYVGSHGRQRIEIYARDGRALGALGDVVMPNDLAFSADGTLWVADSAAGAVVAFPPGDRPSWSIQNAGELSLVFPVALAAGAGPLADRLWVADQVTGRVHLFTLEGVHQGSWGERVPAFSSAWQGRFVRLQSLDFDAQGRLHVLDVYLHRVQIVDPTTGSYLAHYGQLGRGVGELNVPLDLLVESGGESLIANAGSHRLERLANAGVAP